MSEAAKISVIIPVYNAAPYLPRCLDSILTQDYDNLEIICVNDGSTDDSGEVLAAYAKKDSRIRLFNEENGGAARSRQRGVDLTHFKKYAILNACIKEQKHHGGCHVFKK